MNTFYFNIGKTIFLNQELDLEKHKADNNQLKHQLKIEVAEKVRSISLFLTLY